MTIRELFSKDRDPIRHLNEVVNAEEAIDVRSEIDEYVFTEHTREYLRTLIDGILDTGQGVFPDCLRGWISGFFGSGKSHFLKLAATLLENPVLRVEGGIERPALEYAVARHNLNVSWKRIAAEFKIRSVKVNLALAYGGGRQAQEQPLLYRLTSELNRAFGFSSVPHIAEIEREIQKTNKWNAFLEAVRRHNESVGEIDASGAPRPWTDPDVRNKAADAHLVLETVLPQVLPRIHSARSYLEDKEGQMPSPEEVVRLATDFAVTLHPDLGRVLLCLDEVALYLRGSAGNFDADRVRQVQGLAETIKNKGKGRLFLFATAQLRVDTIDSAFAGTTDYVNFLKDRFPRGGRLELEERDIDTVVRERWLKKDPSCSHFAALLELLAKHGDLLARAAKLHDENLIRDSAPLTDENSVLAYYPCLPYHVRLLQEILAALRKEKQIDQTAAQSRALLTSVRSLFLPQNGAALAKAPIGILVTFDKVYDVVRDVVRKADAQTDQWITGAVAELGRSGSIDVTSVAKVIFLLQHLNPPGHRRILVDAENLAALLYPRLGAAWDPHVKDVRDACRLLLDQHFIGEDPESGYRFYRKEERSFQEEVARQAVDDAKLRELLREAITKQATELGMKYVQIDWHKLPVAINVHVGQVALPDPNATPVGLTLHLVWPKTTPQPNQAKIWATQYAGSPHLAIWYLAGGEAEDLARKVLKIEATLRDHEQRYGQHAIDLLRGEQTRVATMREREIPKVIERAITDGTLIYLGVQTALTGQSKKPEDVFRETMRRAAGQVFADQEYGLAQVDEVGLKRVFTWKPGQTPPDFFAKLHLFDSDGHPLVDRRFLKELILALQGRPENQRTGNALLEQFNAIPFGWPERAVKAGLGALLRGRQLVVRLPDGAVLRSEKDPRADNWISGTQLFGKAVLERSDFTITLADREVLTTIFDGVFSEPGADTVEKLEQRTIEIIPQYLGRAREAHADLAGRQLPGAGALKTLVGLLETAKEPELPAGKLKQLLAKAQEIAKGQPVLPALAPLTELLRAVERLRVQGGLDRIASLRGRVSMLYPGWSKRAGTLMAEVQALAATADTEALLRDADQALVIDAEIFKAYAASYRAAHGARQERAAAALNALPDHRGWYVATAEMQRQLCSTISTLDCDGSGSLTLPADSSGRCAICQGTFQDVEAGVELIDLRAIQAAKKLDELVTSPPPPLLSSKSTELNYRVTSAAELSAFVEELAKEMKKRLPKPVNVRITFTTDD